MNTSFVDALDDALPGRVTRNAPSAALTTYRCGGPLAALVRTGSEADLATLAAVVRAEDVEVLVVGRGSNLLVADRGFDGVAILLDGSFDALAPDPGSGTVTAGGAVALPVLARRAAAAGLGGLEFFVGIPGTVGGAVRMNAGGHGRETKDVIAGARLVDLGSGGAADASPAALAHGFRTSAVGPRQVVVRATFTASADDPAAVATRIEEIVRWRRAHQPGGQNAGSVFRNPPGDAAGRLVDAAGAKGMRVGGAVVSEKHANFIVAGPGATATDVHDLLRAVQHRVEVHSGIHLEPEVHLVGFASEPAQ